MSSISRAVLLEALERVKPAIASKDIVPAQKQVYLIGDYLYAFNGEAGIKSRAEFMSDLGEFNIRGELFLALLKSLSSKDLYLTVEKGHVIVECGTHKSRMPQLKNATPSYPVDGEPGPEEWVDAPPGFCEAFIRCLTMVSKHDSRAHLCGVFIKGNNFYATDGNIGMRCTIEGVPDTEHGMLLPRESAEAIVELGQPLRIATQDKTLWLDYGDTMFFTLLWNLDAPWPYHMMDSFVDSVATREFYDVPEELVTSLERLMLFSNKEGVHIWREHDDMLRIQLKDSTEDIEFVGEMLRRVKVNPSLLLTTLHYAETIAFGEEPNDPIATFGSTAETTAFVMPMGD